VPQFRTLAYLNRHEGASLSDAAEHIGLTLPSMSSLINGLVARHLVARQTHTGDRRRVTLALTERGRTVLQISHEAAQDRLAKLIAALPVSERVAVGRAMQALHPVFMPGYEAERNGR
jgi:DNA-binding MarR family transcriptional regulator